MPEGVSIRIYFGTDLISVFGRGDPIYAIGSANSGTIWNGWSDYFNNGGLARGAWYVSDIFIVNDPQPPAILDPTEVHFVKYWRKTPTGLMIDGIDWLPDPATHDSLIGIEFSCTDPDSNEAGSIVYEIYDVTQWYGKDMNTEFDACQNESTRDDSVFFDFHVYNPLYGGNPKYTVTTTSLDYNDYYFRNSRGNYGQLMSIRRYTVERNQPAKGDTLWLIARDYAAHAVVVPRGASTNILRLREHTSPFDTTAALWSVTVPRDYDGWQDVGVNKGDLMADAWEEMVLKASQRSDSTLLTFYPFYCKDTQDAFNYSLPADLDSKPTGRQIDGDLFVNWVEYRGFHVMGDIDSVKYVQPKHVRLNPTKKTVMIDWQLDIIEPEIGANFPGYICKLESSVFDTLEMYGVESHLHRLDRFNTCRTINPNIIGASSQYFSVPEVTTKPAPCYQNAISWWPVNDDEDDWFQDEYDQSIQDSGCLGMCLSEEETGTFCVPKYHSRCWIYLPRIKQWEHSYYYAFHPAQWLIDYPQMIKNSIAHEFGHSVGMEHVFGYTIMDDPAPIYRDQSDTTNYGKFFYPIYTKNYSRYSFDQISTKD